MELNSHIAVKGVFFGYNGKPVLEDINFHIRAGEIVTLLGPNGCGKSTLIKIILGLLHPARGSVFINGTDITRLSSKTIARKIAYVPQTHRSSFPYSVTDIVLMGRIPHKTFFYRYSNEDIKIAKDAMERLSISHLAMRPYTELSGGERQLAIIARAIAQGAKTIIMDEPASGLDYGNQLRLLEQIINLSGSGYTFVKSTHSPEHALWVADRAIMIKSGGIVADGKCNDIVNSENLFHLYNAKIDVMRVNGSLRFCAPRSICRRYRQEEKI
ncbi:MAG: ABC transporter ATP-binding protein [Proteobacteria bacterium]|nr:ABC transporter ATP-binding protein [Pseudomonadota bacterium]